MSLQYSNNPSILKAKSAKNRYFWQFFRKCRQKIYSFWKIFQNNFFGSQANSSVLIISGRLTGGPPYGKNLEFVVFPFRDKSTLKTRRVANNQRYQLALCAVY